jgi:hypothetical protein
LLGACADTRIEAERTLRQLGGSAGLLMETVELFASDVQDPDTLKILTQAFDRAWSEIECRYVELPPLREQTRRRLADCILQIVKDGIRDPEHVKNSALVILAV